ncbi:MAG: HAD family hydrolase [Oscillospiraceae bacterium]
MRDIRYIKAAIFDLDGTLLDSSTVWEGLGERFLARRGITPKPGLSALLNFMTLTEGCEFLRQEYRLPETAAEIQSEICGIIADFYRNECGLKPGAEQLLRELHRRGIALVIATAGEEALSRAALERLGVLTLFRGIVTCAEYGSKTRPDIFLNAAVLVGSPPTQTAVFEDSLHAVRTAKEAGFLTAAVADMSEPDQPGLRLAADYYRQDPGDFLALFI